MSSKIPVSGSAFRETALTTHFHFGNSSICNGIIMELCLEMEKDPVSVAGQEQEMIWKTGRTCPSEGRISEPCPITVQQTGTTLS